MPRLVVDERYVWAELRCLRMTLIDVMAGKRKGMEVEKATAIAGEIERLAAAVVGSVDNRVVT